MAQHNVLGKEGEALAVAYLMERGYQVLHCNWRFSHYEIDIIALLNNRLHFIEVKSRSSKDFGFPEEKVTKKKFQNLAAAASEFLFQNLQYKHIQFDILSINKPAGAPAEYFMIEDVYL
ncbi:MAG: hypothetical protein JWP88_2259 [Flaviaesturariibacter sp.]|nr:hypothetical protein [Flaviaesturariibacter sp.]